jgi:hypothetical protein
MKSLILLSPVSMSACYRRKASANSTIFILTIGMFIYRGLVPGEYELCSSSQTPSEKNFAIFSKMAPLPSGRFLGVIFVRVTK